MFPQSLLSIFVIMNIRIPITIAKKVEMEITSIIIEYGPWIAYTTDKLDSI